MHFPGRRFGHVTSGISESFNGVTLHHRYSSILIFLDAMWNDTMEQRYQRELESQTAIDESTMPRASPAVKITPYARSKILESIAISKGNTAKVNTMDAKEAVATIMTKDNRAYIVNVPEKTCTCRRYQDLLLPCGHAITALHKLGINPMAHHLGTWTVLHWHRTYDQNILWDEEGDVDIGQSPGDELREQLMRPIDLDALEADPTVKAPANKKNPGKAQTKRLTQGQRQTVQNPPVYHCERCGEHRHNKRTCQKVFEG